MNNKLIFVALGWVMGFVSAYFLIRKDFNNQLEEEIEKTREYYRKIDQRKSKNQENHAEKDKECKEEVKKENDHYEKMVNLYREPTPEPLDIKEMRESEPYVIDEDTYFENELNYEQVSLTYYEEDKVLCYEYEEIVDDINYLIGNEALESFEGDIVYVCNDKIGSLYEITRFHQSYKKEVLGIGEGD